jgi:hypothetical protein
MHIGKEATTTSTLGVPLAATEKTRPAPQSENQSSPSRQRGDSPNTMPSINTPMTNQTILGAKAHRWLDHPAPPDAVNGETIRWTFSTSLVGQRPDSLRRRVADPVAAWLHIASGSLAKRQGQGREDHGIERPTSQLRFG